MPIKGKTKRQLRLFNKRLESVVDNDNIVLGVKTPLEKGYKANETLFRMHTNIADQIKNNFKNLVMTRKGEKLCYYNYGIELSDIYTLTNESDDAILEIVGNRINDAVTQFIPSIRITNIFRNEVNSKQEQKNEIENKKTFDFYNSHNIEITKKTVSKEDEEGQDKKYSLMFEYIIPLLNNKTETCQFVINIKTSS